MDGMVRIDCPSALNGYLMKLRFKRWAKVWTPGNIRLHSIENARRIEERDYRVGTFLYQLPVPGAIKKTVTSKRYSFKKRMACRTSRKDEAPTSFLFECFNPQDRTVPLSLTIRAFDKERKIPFQRLIHLNPGFQTVRIPAEEIARVVDLHFPFHIELVPNDIGEDITLYFGLLEFVQEVQVSAKPKEEGKKKVKCVVWDLDHTLWDGVLVEDGPGKLRLKRDIANVIQTLDRRGILQSIASKNNHDEAMEVLRQFRLDEFFLSPQISWAPKGEAVRTIARQLNIGIDSLLFVDDSEFELQQVKASCPEVLVLDAKHYASLPEMEECQVPVTAESAERRKMYQVEHARQNVAETFKDDYIAFLRHSNIQLKIMALSDEHLERVHELTQRTNQMNFSGNRYERESLKNILRSSSLDAHVLACEDRFGSYGVVGLGIVDNREPRLVDLMFSCRIQSKRVEHAFLGFLICKYTALTGKEFHANYRKTPRNAPSGQVFADLGMQEEGVVDGVTSFVFPRHLKVADDGIINIVVMENATVLE
jgi:FkbH-like protein